MLSVLIETHNDEEALARTLTSLVPAAVEGVVREVIVCDRGSTDQTKLVAEHVGCSFLEGADVAAGARRAKSEWLLLVEPGAKLVDGWIEAAIAHVEAGRGAGRFTRSRHARRGLLERLLKRRRPLEEGLVIARRDVLAMAGDVSAQAIARAARSRILAAEIVPAVV